MRLLLPVLAFVFLSVPSLVRAEPSDRVLWPGGELRLLGADAQDDRFPWPCIRLAFVAGERDLSVFDRLEVAVSNRTARPVRVSLAVRGVTFQGLAPGGAVALEPHRSGILEVPLKCTPWVLDAEVPLHGMNGVPRTTPAPIYDLSRMKELDLYTDPASGADAFAVERVVAVSDSRPRTVLKADGFLPFVDRYGQFRHADWPGKTHADEDLVRFRDREAKWLAENGQSPIPDADVYGGWAAGPKLKATGRFRTEKIDGRWWFVDPDGHLFFSLGVDDVCTYDVTCTRGRESYFEWLPKRDDPVFAGFWGEMSTPSFRGYYRDPAHLPTPFFNFAEANARRKYGEDWGRLLRERAHARLRAWGLNTIGCWSSSRLCDLRRTPYVASFSTGGCKKKVKDSNGWWGALPDPWSDEFASCVRQEARRLAPRIKDDPWCLGVFVDNELSWNDKPGMQEIAERYYSVVSTILREELPGVLYLGSRIVWGSKTVFRAAAKYCDVVSVNMYERLPNKDLPSDAVDKPMINGEFHFGVFDRGVLHPGLLVARDQEDRGDCFRDYVNACLDHPRLVGTHWFQWCDQPLAGRHDGENFAVGLVDVTDRPHPEMVKAMRTVAAGMYARRYKGGARDMPPNWQSPRTNRRHLQPPLAERMVTLCSEGRLILSPVHYDPKACWGRYRYENLQGDAFWFVRGEAVGLFDPKMVKVVLPEDGVPLHDLEETSNGVTVRLETCCDFVRKPTVHGRLVVRNASPAASRERFAVRVRHGAETELIRTKNGTGPDFYCVYEPYREAWAALTNDWSPSGRCLTSPEGGFMCFRTLPESATWDAARGELGFELEIPPGAERAFEFTFGSGTVVEPDFSAVRTQTAAAWRRELARLNRLPRHIAENPLWRRMVQNLTVQTLQCLQRPVGCDFVLPRQGGQHRNVWPWDCAAALWPFSKLGDFDDCYEGVLAFFFDIYGQPGNYAEPQFAGRIGPFPIDWACNTANVLGILSRYCLDTGNRRVWEKYRARAFEGFRWINGFRVKPGEGKNLLVGLFRPIRSTDYDSAGQSWTITDPHNLEELKDYLTAAERFNDPALNEIRAGYADYFAALTAASRRFKSTMTDDTFRQPLVIRDGKALHDRVRLAYIVEFAFEAGVLSAEDIRWIWERSVEGGVATMRGLHARYPVHGEWGDVHIWYTTAQDAIWHRMLRRAGERELADRTLEATFKYAMTPEMYLGERFCDMNPDYLPWSPNASGSGRVIRMLYEAK